MDPYVQGAFLVCPRRLQVDKIDGFLFFSPFFLFQLFFLFRYYLLINLFFFFFLVQREEEGGRDTSQGANKLLLDFGSNLHR